MQIIYNRIIPFSKYKAINLFGIIFSREKLSEIDKNHEYIHTLQMKEMLYIFFYIWYVIEWIIRLFLRNNNPYKMISFEVEAYANQRNLNYKNERKHYNWLKL